MDDHRWAEWRNEELELDKKSFKKALPDFHAYLSHLDMIDEVYRQYNEYRDNHLTKDELKLVLTQLNNGIAPTEAQLDEVMREADEIGDGTVTKPELSRAIAVWYAELLPSDQKKAILKAHNRAQSEHDLKKTEEGLTKLTEGGGSSCCSVQ